VEKNHNSKSGFLALDGSPYQLGRSVGESGATVLRRRTRHLKRQLKANHIPERVADARVRDFIKHVRKVARHWLDEARGLAEGSGVRVEDILRINCPPPGISTGALESCTSFISIGRSENWLFKIRDERYNTQCFYIDGSMNGTRVQSAKDIGNLGTAHFFNGSALAGACDTGSPTDLVTDEPRLNDCHLMRLIAESCRTVDEIPRFFERLIDADVVGGAGPGRGAILLFVDHDKGLILECESGDYAVRFLERGTHAVSNHFLIARSRQWESAKPGKNTLARRARMAELLARHGRSLSESDVFAISRDRKGLPNSLCNDQFKGGGLTVSAQLQVVPRKDPDRSINYVCCGNTRNSLYIPVPVHETKTYGPMMDGRFFSCADTLYRTRGCGPHLRSLQTKFERRTINAPDYEAACQEAYSLLRSEATAAKRSG
jgi:hypothetical protein